MATVVRDYAAFGQRAWKVAPHLANVLGRLRRIWPTRSQCAIVPYFALIAAAVGLLQPGLAGGQPLGLLDGCRGSDRDRVCVLSPRETDAVQRGSKNGSRHWESAVQRSSTAQRVAIKTAHAMDLLLAYAVGLRRPRDAPGGGCLPVAQGWTGVAELVAHLVHAYTTTLFGGS
eukprot:COSAG06_NODE_17069_length_963_cov_0.652778_1_plen_173_part_00